MKQLHSRGDYELDTFKTELETLLVASCNDQEVVGFKA